VWLEGLIKLKNPVTLLGIDPATFRLVAQCLNQLRYCMPPEKMAEVINDEKESSGDHFYYLLNSL
jgi:hypothetical protein